MKWNTHSMKLKRSRFFPKTEKNIWNRQHQYWNVDD